MIECRQLSSNDLAAINTCIQHHDKMYGVPIDQASIFSKFEYHLSENKVFGAYSDGDLIGICTQSGWEMMPVWTLSNLFMINNQSTLLLSDQFIRIIGAMMETAIATAEKENRYEFYYVIRDSKQQSRKSHGLDIIARANNTVASRYDYTTIHVLNSESKIEWQYIKNIIGDIGIKSISAPYNKILNLRRATIKNEFRP